jgi:hypothetical protein
LLKNVLEIKAAEIAYRQRHGTYAWPGGSAEGAHPVSLNDLGSHEHPWTSGSRFDVLG